MDPRDDGLGFELLLPRRLEPADTGTLIEINFSAIVLREVGTLFSGRVFDTTRPHEVRQRILPGEAAPEIESERLSVTTLLSGSLVFSPLVSPNPFTPNGDGINDVVSISYKLLRVTSGRAGRHRDIRPLGKTGERGLFRNRSHRGVRPKLGRNR